jgi:hypothetical protein
LTVEVERYDGDTIDADDLREALEAEGYKLRTWSYGRHLLAPEAVTRARAELNQALSFLEDDKLFPEVPTDG